LYINELTVTFAGDMYFRSTIRRNPATDQIDFKGELCVMLLLCKSNDFCAGKQIADIAILPFWRFRGCGIEFFFFCSGINIFSNFEINSGANKQLIIDRLYLSEFYGLFCNIFLIQRVGSRFKLRRFAQLMIVFQLNSS